MAKLTVEGFSIEDFSDRLQAIAEGLTEIETEALYKGAGIITDEIRANLEKNLRGSKYSKGDLLESLGISPAKVDDKGDLDVHIGFGSKGKEYDRRGTSNVLKARAMENGTSKQKKKPFIRPAVRKTKEKAAEVMAEVIQTRIQEKFRQEK